MGTVYRRTRKTLKKSLTSSSSLTRTKKCRARHHYSVVSRLLIRNRYKIGDSFVSLPLPEVQELLSESTTRIDAELTALEEKLSRVREEMAQTKVALYARFGRTINLET